MSSLDNSRTDRQLSDSDLVFGIRSQTHVDLVRRFAVDANYIVINLQASYSVVPDVVRSLVVAGSVPIHLIYLNYLQSKCIVVIALDEMHSSPVLDVLVFFL